MLSRAGLTLVEVLVALTLAALVLGTATVSVLGQQRAHARLRAVLDADAQISAAMTVLGEQLGMLNVRQDLMSGEARDSALQFRAPVASAIACAGWAGRTTLAADPAGSVPLLGVASLPRTGDTLWWLGDSAWVGGAITAVTNNPVTCASPLGAMSGELQVTLARPDSIASGTPLRITRQTRYGVYRASDGTWHLGFREWSSKPPGFPSPQPVVGSLIRTGSRRSGFRYFDDTGAELDQGTSGADVTRVARIRFTAHAFVPVHDRGRDSVRTDSIDIVLQHARGP